MANKIISKLRAKAITWLNEKGEPVPNQSVAPTVANVMACYRSGSYDNTFPNITRIAEAFAEVAPYAIDANGEALKKQPHLIDILFNPNEEMSGPDFWETLIVMMLVHPVVHILCWHKDGDQVVPGGPITPENIAGFTFMEDVGVSTISGTTQYFYNGEIYGKRDVLALSLNVNPYNLLAGYSPTLAAKKWATVDDYAADYQAGWFRNGAVPPGQFVVTAPTVEEFNKIVDTMQATHRGANQANNPMYVHRPTSAIDGKPMAAQVEWVPFAQTSEKGTLQTIFDQANKKLDMDFGVPEEINGRLSNSTYASAEVADYVFSRRVVYPKLRKVWAKMTHEMNRVTGGLGFALSFDYEIPVLTDMRKVQAETLQIMINSGFTVDSSVEALQLPSSFKSLEKAKEPEISSQTENDNTSVETSEATQEISQKRVKNNDCGSQTHAKAVDVDTSVWRSDMNPELEKVLSAYLNGIIDEAIARVRENPASIAGLPDSLKNWLRSSKYPEKTINMIVGILTYIMLNKGQEAAADFAQQLGLDNLEMEISDENFEKLHDRIEELIYKFGDDTIDNLGKIIDNQPEDSGTDSLITALEYAKETEQYRVDRWVVSEQHEAEEQAVLIAAIIAADESNMIMYKTWRVDPTSADMCADCLNMDGQTVRIDEAFSNGDMVPHYHPFCRCKLEFTWRPATKSVKITCPHCGRYMMESTGGTMKNVICANSKCKRHYDIEVTSGKVKAIEIAKTEQ